jgi:hypothetical protein
LTKSTSPFALIVTVLGEGPVAVIATVLGAAPDPSAGTVEAASSPTKTTLAVITQLRLTMTVPPSFVAIRFDAELTPMVRTSPVAGIVALFLIAAYALCDPS